MARQNTEMATWKECFNYVIRLQCLSGHPPFCKPNKWLVGTQLLILVAISFRMFMTVILGEEGWLLGTISLLIQTNIFAGMVQMNRSSGKFKEYFKDIDSFLKDAENNSITGKTDRFMKTWKRERPDRLVTVLLVLPLGIVFLWSFETVYLTATSKVVAGSLYWSPFFRSSRIMPWLYVIQELTASVPLMYLHWCWGATFMSCIKFHLAQLIYMKEELKVLVDCEFHPNKREKFLWWLKVHQQVLGSTYKINDIFGLNALVSFATQTFFSVLCIVIFLFKNITLDQGQRTLCLLIGLAQMMEFGHNCVVIDRWEEEQRYMRDIIFCEKLMKGDKWLVSVYKMVNLRMNKPLKFTGLNVVTLNSVTFRGMVINVYSMCTSLITLLN